MSFGISVGGNKENTLAALKRSTGHGDATHHDALRDAAVKIVEAAPDDATFFIEAGGHHAYTGTPPVGATQGSATFSIRIA